MATVDAITGDVTIVGAGTAVIKATIADGINYTYAGNNEATCTLTVKDPVALADVTAAENLGWVIGSDKQAYVTATGASAAGVTPVAMIGYVGSAGSADASSATYRGLAVALQDVYLDPGTTTLWSNAQGTCTTTVVLLSDAMTVCNGIAVTASLVGCASHVHQAASMANSYNTDLATPTGCSDWFLPSSGQWCKVLEACGIDFSGWTEFGYGPGGAVNYTTAQALISAVGDPFSTTKYWTSTEYNARFAWTVEFDSESGIGLDVPMKTTTYGNVYNVRPFMAF